MEIKIEVPEVTLNTVVGDIVRVDGDGEEYIDGQMTVADKVAQLIKAAVVKNPEYTALRERVTEIRNQEIREAVKPLIREALERPIRRTNSFGERVGNETTLAELIMDEAKKTFTEVKDSYRCNKPFITEVVAAEVQKAFRADIQEQVQKARAAVAAQLGSTMTEEVMKVAMAALAKGGK
ncbi:hypothetical protein AS594_07225 [Streptomyces agglomeratus]|uniref:Uncharacterized protein n=1 Tax=Streptomyces agglomeratus TaxID=285458 RepID=A0A1E5P4P5_9ACTN|nr:hypothetical protein [Streptomyces agglomeratus]OEJ24314.1 hypothetical protein AS594_07225 [Streptomyces agglomeratus]